jgi:hypothetical protein
VRPAGPILAVALLTACEDTPAPGTTSPAERAGCFSATDCRSGLRCLLGACVAPGGPAGTFSLRVVPPQNLPAVAVEVPDIAFDGLPVFAPDQPLVLPDRAILVGRAVTADAPPLDVAVDAQAVVRGAVAAEGQTIAGRAVVTPRGPRFTFTMAPCWPDFSGTCKDTVFTVRLNPDPTQLPPAEFRDLTMRDNLPEEERPFLLPGTAEPPAVSGTVTLFDATPLFGLTVFGVDDTGQRITTMATTGVDGGFSIRHWPYHAGHRIRLLATSRDAERPLPVLAHAVTLAEAGSESPPVPIVVPDIGSTFTARGRVTSLDGAPVPGARIRFRTTTAAGEFTVDAAAADDGGFTPLLYPGTYVVDVEPALGTGLRILRTEVDARADGPALDIRLKPLVPVRGRIVWPDATPIARARVQARLQQVAAGRPELLLPDDEPPTRIVEGETDGRGVFTLLLDPGAQSLTMTPLAGLGLPTSSQDIFVPIESGLGVDLGDVTVLPAGVVQLEVLDVRELPVAGAGVQVWRTDAAGGPRKVAEGTTDATGAAVIRVPAEAE